MKLLYVLFAFLSIAVGPVRVFADRNIAVSFAPSGDASCNDIDKALIAPIFNISNYKIRRQLRSVSSNATVTGIADRGLTVNECKNRCRGFAGGFCHAMPVCNVKRRALQDNLNPLYTTCSSHVAEVNARLDELITTSTLLSAGCKELIRADNRNATCEDGILPGEISGFSIHRIGQRLNTCPAEMELYYMCRSLKGFPTIPVTANNITVKLSAFNMFANVQVQMIPCISTVQLSIVGPRMNSNRVITIPSGGSLYVSALSDYQKIYPGIYTVTATPDNKPSKAKSFTMTVIK